jgi:hypothetical protein
VQARLFGRRRERAAQRAGGARRRQQPFATLQARSPTTRTLSRGEHRLQTKERPDIAIHLDLAGNVGTAQAKFVGLPEQAAHSRWRLDDQGGGAAAAAVAVAGTRRRCQLATIPAAYAQRWRAAAQVMDQRRERFGDGRHSRQSIRACLRSACHDVGEAIPVNRCFSSTSLRISLIDVASHPPHR